MVRLRSGVAPNLVRPGSAQAVSHLRNKRQLKQALYNGQQLPKNTTISPPPPGYTFLSMGHPDLSAKCKELSKEKDVEISVVSATNRDQDQSKSISHHLHRIGYHIRTDIFDEACTWLGYREVNGKLIKDPVPDPTSGFERTLARYGADFSQLGATKASNEQSEKIKGAIRELFPKIPEQSLNDIFETAWQKGASTVGNVDSLPLSRRIQLAVVAHIRHMHTDYDRILQTSSWAEARRAVEPYCLAKLVEWRGEDGGHDDAIDDILQHAILLSDDEYSPAEHSEPDRYADNEDSNSEETDEMAVRKAHAAALARATSVLPSGYTSFQPGAPASHPRPIPMRDRQRQMLRARWEDARTRARQHPTLGTSATLDGNPLFSRLPQISAPTDHRGRAPKKFIENGIEYTRATPEQLAPYGIIVPAPTYTSHPTSHIQTYPQQPHTHAPPAANRPRLFDEEGREVFFDPTMHHLTPAHPFGTANITTAPSDNNHMRYTPQALTGILPSQRVRTVTPESVSARSRISKLPSQALALTKPSQASSKKSREVIRYSDPSSSETDEAEDEDEEYDPSKPLLSARRLSGGFVPAPAQQGHQLSTHHQIMQHNSPAPPQFPVNPYGTPTGGPAFTPVAPPLGHSAFPQSAHFYGGGFPPTATPAGFPALPQLPQHGLQQFYYPGSAHPNTMSRSR